ncbi:ABC-type Fe3+-siderophore transport system,permease component [Pseudoalteromonas luteoviolacea B = ATCC 29581]|nr:ABC-type Fe3+-siderophore transport system,permease component [Pseudoalteromonas luteoviolacea B = ATCC 29581]
MSMINEAKLLSTQPQTTRFTWLIVALLITLVLLMTLSLATGPSQISYLDSLRYALGFSLDDSDEQLRMMMDTLRIPRVWVALIVGIGMALSATLLQHATRNPLAEPGLLGVNSGAVFSLVVGMTYFSVESSLSMLYWAGAGALFGNFIVLGMAQWLGQQHPLRLILLGVAMSATFGGLANYLLLADQVVLDQFRYWNLGSLASADSQAIYTALPCFALACALTVWLLPSLRLLQFGDTQAQSLGVNSSYCRLGVLVCSTCFTACAIAIAGPIGFVGFLAAFYARCFYPAKLYQQTVLSALFGGVFILIADILARILIQPFELPSGVLLAFVGGPALMWVAGSYSKKILSIQVE